MNTLIKCYRNARRPEGAEATLHDLSRWGLAPDGCSYCTVIDAWGLAGKPDSAKRVLAEAEAQGTCDARTYSALMRFVPWQEVETLMQRMVCLSVAPDLATCNAALNTLATAGQPEAALQFVQRYMRSAAPPGSRQELSPVQLSLPAPDQRTYSILLKAFCMCGKAAQAESMLRLMLTHGYPLNVPAFSTVMNALVSARPPNVNAAEALMRDAEAHGLKPDTQVCHTPLAQPLAQPPAEINPLHTRKLPTYSCPRCTICSSRAMRHPSLQTRRQRAPSSNVLWQRVSSPPSPRSPRSWTPSVRQMTLTPQPHSRAPSPSSMASASQSPFTMCSSRAMHAAAASGRPAYAIA